ncbi:VOC family protein [Pseudonocardia sp. WMMC193]|uniref:VOC family protein n=1 Tax=Pseudonocardia sp. WMMC193 TaxID=2911965 RepID=UPI001F2F1DAB|nr:VOC family protein [Pseudonocardia sp. WMMC193]MCF7549088.1 VOC family protein [Pseudonocardia sp. WMMC193]
MKSIQNCLWFDGQAREAAEFYCSVFPNSRITRVQYYPEGAPGPAGEVMYVEFTLDGREFAGLNGGPQFPHSEAVSFVVPVESDEENDRYYAALVAGGSERPCGWLKDRFGVSWQVVPVEADEWMRDPDPEKANRVFAAMLQMHGKLDIETLRKAYLG